MLHAFYQCAADLFGFSNELRVDKGVYLCETIRIAPHVSEHI
jgi:hypothetical protein